MSRYFNIKVALAFLAICCVAGDCAAAQKTEGSKPIIINGSSNETVKAQLDLLAQTVGDDKLIIAIAHLGNGESSPRLNRRRLRSIRSYLETVRAVPEQKIITAVGESVRGLGRVEVYLCDRLFMIFTLERNKEFAKEQ